MSVKDVIRKGAQFLLDNIPSQTIYTNVINLNVSNLLEKRVALITGGTSGIGYEIAKAFLKAGADVIITGRNNCKIENAVKQIQYEITKKDNCQRKIYGFQLDNLNPEEFNGCIINVENKIGRPIDILVNNIQVY